MEWKLFRRALFAAALGLGLGTGLVRAQAPLIPVPAAPQAPSVVVVNGIIYTNTGVAAPITPVIATPPTAPTAAPCAPVEASAAIEGDHHGSLPHPLRNLWQAHPVATFCHDHKPSCCWTHFNNYTCGSTASEYAFIFGSCRNFFGEPCLNGPPAPAFPGEQAPRNVCPNCARP